MSYAVLDVETTGLNPDSDRIVEIAIISLTDDLQNESTFTTLVKPHHLDPDTSIGGQEFHGLRGTDLAHAPSFSQVADRVISALDGHIVVGHNVNFDLGFLNAEFARAGLNALVAPRNSVCTMNQSRIYLPDGSHSLVGIAERLGIHMDHHHRAEADASTAAEFLKTFIRMETRGERFTDTAVDRDGTEVLPAQWLRAVPWLVQRATHS